jgi:hypothetical protein
MAKVAGVVRRLLQLGRPRKGKDKKEGAVGELRGKEGKEDAELLQILQPALRSSQHWHSVSHSSTSLYKKSDYFSEETGGFVFGLASEEAARDASSEKKITDGVPASLLSTAGSEGALLGIPSATK